MTGSVHRGQFGCHHPKSPVLSWLQSSNGLKIEYHTEQHTRTFMPIDIFSKTKRSTCFHPGQQGETQTHQFSETESRLESSLHVIATNENAPRPPPPSTFSLLEQHKPFKQTTQSPWPKFPFRNPPAPSDPIKASQGKKQARENLSTKCPIPCFDSTHLQYSHNANQMKDGLTVATSPYNPKPPSSRILQHRLNPPQLHPTIPPSP